MEHEESQTRLSRVGRREFLRTASVAALAAACSPSSAPATTSSEPGGSPGKAEWEAEWEKTIAEAKREGVVVISTTVGGGSRNVFDVFEEAFPGIKVEEKGFSTSSQFIPVVTKEHEGGVYNWDLALGSPASLLGPLKPTGVLVPVRPLIIRPEITDDKFWSKGFDFGWVDTEKKLAYAYMEYVYSFSRNGDMVGDNEIKSVEDLLNPKWKGKMIFYDVRLGPCFTLMTSVRLNAGEEVMKRIIVDQQPTFSRDARQIVEGVVRGTYALANTVSQPILEEFQKGGLGKSVAYLDVPKASYISYSYSLFHINRAPHPNAAKVFVNWFLSKEGQKTAASYTKVNSRRTDVQAVSPVDAPKPGRDYLYLGRESSAEELAKTRTMLADMVGIKD